MSDGRTQTQLPDPTTELYVVRLWDGFDGEWMDVSELLTREEAARVCGDKNEARGGSAAGKRDGSYSDIDYYKVFPADTVMHFDGSNNERSMR